MNSKQQNQSADDFGQALVKSLNKESIESAKWWEEYQRQHPAQKPSLSSPASSKSGQFWDKFWDKFWMYVLLIFLGMILGSILHFPRPGELGSSAGYVDVDGNPIE